MASESTAINNLIDLVGRKALPQDDADDWLFGGERDSATEIEPRNQGPSPFHRVQHMPHHMPVQNLFQELPVPPLPAPQVVVTLPQPVRRPSAAIAAIDQTWQKTVRVTKTLSTQAVAKKLVVPIGLFAIVIVLVGVYVAKDGDQPTKPTVVASASAAPIESAPKAAIVVAPAGSARTPIETPAPKAAAPTVTPIEPGLSVTPIESEAAAPIAAAPAAEEPANRFAVKLEPTLATTTAAAPDAVAATTEATTEVAEPAPKSTAKKSKRERARAAKRAKKTKREAKVASSKKSRKQVAAADDEDDEEIEKLARRKQERADGAKPAAKLDGKGTLSITSAEPREVWVDGRNSKRMTPLKVLLLAGKHKVTLFDKAHGKAKTFDVEIKPDQTTKVAK